ncbi:polymeric immunoglobulin receptor-like isoform X4 [Mastacembelus armatus]|uniref:polymeric immunoglobulin receptor-like isoform X4 n=1 Tax=Mastacembelus armatus TaxID=205130 RepID=UPI000E455F45|nr:polymeric immunoglobulin receptor-like isoform X4 [Mastacembelus armatus]
MSACLTWMVSVGLIGSLVLGPVYGGKLDPEQIKAKPGENVTLQCRGSKDDTFRALKWVRRELESEGYVFYFRENRQYESNQLLSFRGRLDLRDPEMKDGDFSVILKNVRISDTGSYECQVGTNGNKPKLINNMSLKVEYPEKTAKPGEDVVLQCQVPTDAEIVMTRWSRPDLKSEGYVYIFKDGRLDENGQHESFRGRVDLRSPEMKDGDFSVILKNIRISDTGSYECYIGKKKPGNLVPEPVELINSTTLKVEDSGHTGGHSGAEGDQGAGNNHGHVGLTVGLTVVGILLLVAAVVGFMFYRKRCRPTDQNPNPRPERRPMNPK